MAEIAMAVLPFLITGEVWIVQAHGFCEIHPCKYNLLYLIYTNVTALVIKTIEWSIILGELRVCFCYKFVVFSSSTKRRSNIELIIRSFAV